jgi:hypothetical protein
VVFVNARRQAGQMMRGRDTREHVALYVKAFDGWSTGEALPQLRFAPRESMPAITKVR